MESEGTATPTITATDVIASSEGAATEAPKVEALAPLSDTGQVEAKKEESLEDESFARKFAALTKRESELRKRDDELKAKANGYASVDEYKKLAKTNINDFLEKTGLSFDEITEYYLSGGQNKDPKLSEVEEKLSSLEKQIRDKEERAAELERQRAVSNYKEEQRKHVMSKPEDYELIAATNSYDLVYDVTKQYYDTHNKILSNDESAKLVEDYLEREVEKVLKASKIRNKFAALPKIETSQKNESAKEQIKTLTNSMTSAANPQTSKQLSREESLERAASLLKFT